MVLNHILKKPMEIKTNIRYYRKKNGLTQVQVAEKLGILQSSYCNWERGKTYPTFENLLHLVDIFGMSLAELMSDEATARMLVTFQNLDKPQQEELLEFAQKLPEQKTIAFPGSAADLTEVRVYERLSAGIGQGLIGDGDYDAVYTDEVLPRFDVASWVSGDSMEPTYLNGSVALLKDTGFDYDGAVYAVEVDETLYIKKVYRETDGLRLVSINEKYDDKFFSSEENPRIIGKVVGNFAALEV